MQRYFAKAKENGFFLLNDDDLYHIKTVMRMKTGDYIEVVYNHNVYLCTLEINQKIIIRNNKLLDQRMNNMPEVTLILPFLKEQKIDLILQKGTELGIKKFIFVETERTIVKIEEKKVSNKLERWSRICKEASEQSMRNDIPNIEIIRDRTTLSNLIGLKLICSTVEKDKTIKKALKNGGNCDKINLMIGPEGGLSEIEEKYFEEMGYEKISLGNQIMRVETVPIFLASIINYEYME